MLSKLGHDREGLEGVVDSSGNNPVAADDRSSPWHRRLKMEVLGSSRLGCDG